MKIGRLILICLSCLLPNCLVAAIPLDSIPVLTLKRAYLTPNLSPKTQIEIAMAIGRHYFWSDFDSTLLYYNLAHTRAKATGEVELIRMTLGAKASVYREYGKLDLSLAAYVEAWERLNRSGRETEALPYLGAIASVYFDAGYFELAKAYWEKVTLLQNEFNKPAGEQFGTLCNLGFSCMELGASSPIMYDSAYYYFNAARDLSSEIDDGNFRRGVVLDYVGELDIKVKNYANAEAHYREELAIMSSFPKNDINWESKRIFLSRANLGLANLYHLQNKPDSVLKYANSALEVLATMEKDANGDRIVKSYFLMGKAWEEKGNPKMALSYMEAGLEAAKGMKTDRKSRLSNAYGEMAAYFGRQKDFEKAFEAAQLRDELNAEIIPDNDKQSFFSHHTDLVTNNLKLELDYHQTVSSNARRERNLSLAIGLVGFVLSFFILFLFYRLRKAHRIQKKTSHKLQALNASRDKLISVLAHDLRSPFQAVLGFSTQILHYVKHQDWQRINSSARIINDSAQEAYYLFENLLDWAKSQTGKIHFQPEELELASEIEEVLVVFQGTIEAKRLRMEIQIPESGVVGDRQMLNTVLRNLIGNAIKFSPIGKTIWIIGDMQEKVLHITIKDKGKGISTSALEALRSQLKKGLVGQGLGLSLSNEFLSLHGSEVEIQSEFGKGTSIAFVLPRISTTLAPSAQDLKQSVIVAPIPADDLTPNASIHDFPEWVAALSEHQIYERSKVLHILDKISESDHPVLQQWKARLIEALDAYDEREFDLLTGRSSQSELHSV